MAPDRKLRVGIIFGGQSAEHEISILSARNVLAALDRSRFEPVLIGVDKQGRWLAQDEQRLLASARDPRLVRIEAGTPFRNPMALAAPDGGTPFPASRRFPCIRSYGRSPGCR
jgi:D-alanine-D-alanine ligase